MLFINQKSDDIGALASTFCLIHCIATPFIFIVQSSSLTCCEGAPFWWSFIDFFFLVISFFAIYQSTLNSVKKWLKFSLWINWFFLFVIIINEKTGWFSLNENLIYILAILLIALHLYNKRNCE